MAKQVNPAQLSDARLLVLNDIYLFDTTLASSVSKYFTFQTHNSIRPSLSFESYFPPNGVQCHDWCMHLQTSPPSEWLASVKLGARMLNDACETENLIDIHTTQVLSQILPLFINNPPDDSIEDSYVHHYLSPLLTTVFGADSLLHMKWANGELKNHDPKAYKPDFLAYNISGNVKSVVVISEFKPTSQNSYVESDLVKLAKQMRFTLNQLVSSGVVSPKICGVHCEGENVHTFLIDDSFRVIKCIILEKVFLNVKRVIFCGFK